MSAEMMEALEAMAAERGISTDVLLQLFAKARPVTGRRRDSKSVSNSL